MMSLRADEMSARTIKKIDGRIYVPNHGRFNAWLHQKLQTKIEYERANGCDREYYLDYPGLHRLPGGGYCYMFNNQLLGEQTDHIYHANTGYAAAVSQDSDSALKTLCCELLFVEPDILTGIAFLAATLVRSGIQATGVDWQVVLYIFGKQGIGKTTLARFLSGWLKNSKTGNIATFHSAGSSTAAMRDSMEAARDLPVVVDDLCLSASRATQRKAIELGAQLIREGTNEASIIKKKPGGHTIEINCQAGLIFTAEFTLDNPSDITRYVFLNIGQQFKLPPISVEQMGSALQCYLGWFASHAKEAFQTLQEAVNHRHTDLHPRIDNNYTILKWAMQQLLLVAVADGLSQEEAERLNKRYQVAERDSMQFQQDKLDELESRIKKENIASLLLKAIKNEDAFHMTKKTKKLSEYAGIWWKGDLCLTRASLERFMRTQKEYQNYTISKVIQELKDIGALVVQEEGTAQVKIKKRFAEGLSHSNKCSGI